VAAVHALNETITADPNLGEGFCIGHSYLCGLDGTPQSLRRLIQTELGPLLREYWFDDPERARQEIEELERVG
jgi:5-methylcytosine-specific restriction protein B